MESVSSAYIRTLINEPDFRVRDQYKERRHDL